MAGLSDITVSNYMKFEIAKTEVTDIESFGGITEESSIVEVKQYNLKFARKLSGSSSVGAIELTCSFNPNSAGYKALAEARSTDTLSDFTITYYNNAAKTEASSRTFKGLVTSYGESSEYDAQRTCTWTIAVDGAMGELKDANA